MSIDFVEALFRDLPAISQHGAAFTLGYALGILRSESTAKSKQVSSTKIGSSDVHPLVMSAFVNAKRRATIIGSDYPWLPEGNGRLVGCADDARTIAELCKKHGFETKTLIDGEATRHAILDCLRRHEEGSAFDTNLLFFSGHGVRGKFDRFLVDEPDRRQDAILVAEEKVITDDDLAVALDRWTGTTVVAIDACHSGGMALETARNGKPVLFIASSDEQSTSLTANSRRAGGYVSAILRDVMMENLARGETLSVADLHWAFLDKWADYCSHTTSTILDHNDAVIARSYQTPVIIRTANPNVPILSARM